MLRLIPRYPSKIASRELKDKLESEGFPITKRTVERDLMSLSDIFPITVDDREKPYGWSWLKTAPILDVPGLTSSQSLAFALVQRFVAPLMPVSTLDELKPYFKAAEQHLGALPKGRGIPSWLNKIRVVHPSQSLIPPKILPDIQHTVYQALLNNQQLRIAYHKRGATGPVEYTVHPLGLVQRGPVMYLVCTLFDYKDVILLAVHRILSAIELDETLNYPKGFDLDHYIASGALHFGVGEQMRLEAIFTAGAAEHLHETALSTDQQLYLLKDGRVRVTATVTETSQLCWWLLGFGDQVEVMKPAKLRAEMATTAKSMSEIYTHQRG
jgi:predicted DNA-binding transcriptional regulator YafY